MQELILSLDTASWNPSASIYSPNDGIQTLKLCTEDGRYDAAHFVDQIAKFCEENNFEIKKITRLAFCAGPGAFTPIRVGCIMARTFKLLNPEIPVYKFNTLNLLYYWFKTAGLKTNAIYIKAGLKGYFKETYSDEDKIIQKAQMVSDFQNDGIIANDELKNKNFNLSETMLKLLLEQPEDWLSDHLVKLEEIQPLYLKEASVTLKKKP